MNAECRIPGRTPGIRLASHKGTMPVATGAYVVAFSMLFVCGGCALALMRMIDRFDPPEVRDLPERRQEIVGV